MVDPTVDAGSLGEYLEEHIDTGRTRSLLGRVNKVFPHDDSSDLSNHEVNVETTDGLEEFRRIPVSVGRNGHARVPQKGDVVEVSFAGRQESLAYVSGFVYTDQTRAPLARAGHWRHRFGDSSPYLFVEAEKSDHSAGHPDVVRIAKKTDGLSDPDAVIEMDADGNIRLEADGNITLSAPNGDVQIDEGGTAEAVAVQSHDHDFTYDGGGDNSSTQSGTTGTPNQSGSSVEIE